jgi:DNA-directed RNA polymerase subunit K/omega
MTKAVIPAEVHPPSPLLPPPNPSRAHLQNTFHRVVVASQRAKQLAAGARPRVDPGTHRHARVALLEVMAGLVSWSMVERVPVAEVAPASKE